MMDCYASVMLGRILRLGVGINLVSSSHNRQRDCSQMICLKISTFVPPLQTTVLQSNADIVIPLSSSENKTVCLKVALSRT